ncbi:MAG: ornithine cyclodeaminase family protein [Chloroflexi bacterium]|nr:ornithine cyclodeaminase family protein [Chloroflexota bacterium]
MTLLLSRAHLAAALDVPSAIAAVEAGFAEYTSGKIQAPLRQHLEIPEYQGIVLTMPGAAHEARAVGVKIASVFPHNSERGLPRLCSIYLLLDYATGQPLAVMDGSALSAVRTAAASAVATRWLARAEAGVLGIFGTGVQAEGHALALPHVRPIRRVLVLGTSTARSHAFAARLASRLGLPVEAAASAEQLDSESDILVAATTSPTPLFQGAWVRPGTHINAVGAFTPGTREVDAETVRRAHVVVDTYEGALAEAGDLLIPLDQGLIDRAHLAAELGEVVLGQRPGRRSEDEVTLFKSVGAAFEDVVAARRAYDRAVELGLGERFEF